MCHSRLVFFFNAFHAPYLLPEQWGSKAKSSSICHNCRRGTCSAMASVCASSTKVSCRVISQSTSHGTAKRRPLAERPRLILTLERMYFPKKKNPRKATKSMAIGARQKWTPCPRTHGTRMPRQSGTWPQRRLPQKTRRWLVRKSVRSSLPFLKDFTQRYPKIWIHHPPQEESPPG